MLASMLTTIDLECNKHFMDFTELHETFQIQPKCAFDQKSIDRCGPPIDIIRYIQNELLAAQHLLNILDVNPDSILFIFLEHAR